jgi:tetratricopeptide (TPR) repeat protein
VPKRPRSHQLETESNRAFERALPSRWVERRLVPDYGLDYTVEIVAENHRTTPYSFHVQLKATDSGNRAEALSSVRFDREWAEHYWSLPIPVLIVRYLAAEDRLYARWFHAYNPHVALRASSVEPTRSIGFRFTEEDAWTEETPASLEAAVVAFMRYRSPEIELPLRFAVSSTEAELLPVLFAMRAIFAPIADIVAVESGRPGPDRPYITIGRSSSTVALADVASVTLDHPPGVTREVTTDAADLATAIAVALIRVGQSNLAVQIAAACSATSAAILDYEVVFSLAQASYRARRITDVLRLAERVNERPNWEGRTPAMILQTAVLARGSRLTAEEAELAVDVRRDMFDRTAAAGQPGWAAVDAYNLGQALHRGGRRRDAIDAYRQAASLDNSYEGRGYFNRDLAALLFEDGQFAEAAARYRRAQELEHDPFIGALLGDALLWSGEYAKAHEAFEAYVASSTRSRDAEWRLKARASRAIRDIGGDRQVRDPARAAALIAPFDFAAGREFDPLAAKEGYIGALEADACCAEAWFRLAFLMLLLSEGEEVVEAFELNLTSAVLHRFSPGAWNNTLRMLRAATLSDDLARDCLRMAYRCCGAEIANSLLEGDGSSSEGPDGELMDLLDEVMHEVDEAGRPMNFTLRVPDGRGRMSEIAFVTAPPADSQPEAHPHA